MLQVEFQHLGSWCFIQLFFNHNASIICCYLAITIGFRGGSEGVFIGLQELLKSLFSTLVFPLLEPLLIISQLCRKHYYAHAIFTQYFTHFARVLLRALAPCHSTATKMETVVQRGFRSQVPDTLRLYRRLRAHIKRSILCFTHIFAYKA